MATRPTGPEGHRERPPVERELIARSAWIIRLRWGAGVAVVIGAMLGGQLVG
jgi:hypothetical protein